MINTATLVLCCGCILCLVAACLQLKKNGMRCGGLWVFLLLAPLLALFFGHFFYCLMRFDYAWYDMAPGSFPGAAFLRFWDGNYMLYGGAAGVILALAIAGKIGGGSMLRYMDGLSPWGALCIAFVRLFQGMSGGFYSLELIQEEDEWGEVIPGPWQGLPFTVYDDYYEVWHWALFIPAILIALILFLVLIRPTCRPDGDRALLLAGMYASAQIILESLRRDDVLRWGFVRCSQLISALLALAVLLLYFRRGRGSRKGLRIAMLALFGLCLVICFIMEFAQEQRITALTFLSMQSCYLISALSCGGIAASILGMRVASAPLAAGTH